LVVCVHARVGQLQDRNGIDRPARGVEPTIARGRASRGFNFARFDRQPVLSLDRSWRGSSNLASRFPVDRSAKSAREHLSPAVSWSALVILSTWMLHRLPPFSLLFWPPSTHRLQQTHQPKAASLSSLLHSDGEDPFAICREDGSDCTLVPGTTHW
jgi:hypothetical protein